MVEPVTKQFADKVTGTPIVGGDFQLRDILGIAPSVAMTECTDPLYPGRYTADEDLRPGIWAVQRRTTGDYEDTGEYVTVGPGWTFAGEISEGSDVVPVELILGSVVNATAFVPLLTGGAPTSAPTIAHLQAAVNYAADAGIKRVYVGSYKGINDWQGASALDLTAPALAGIILDLGGARLKRTTSGGPVINMLWGFICNGTIEGTGNDPVPEITANNDGWTPVCCYHVNFTREPSPSDTSATVQASTGGLCAARFLQCIGHSLYKEATGTGLSSTRLQTSDTLCKEVSTAGGFESFAPPEQGNYQGSTPANFFAEGLSSDMGALDNVTAPFADAINMARALKRLWFVQNPKLERVYPVANLSDKIVVLGPGTTTMTPTAVFAAYVGLGSEDTKEGACCHKDGEEITDTENGISSARSFRLQSGLIVKKEYQSGDTKYEKISLSAHLFFLPSTILSITSSYARYPHGIAWLPKLFKINTATIANFLQDLDGTTMTFPENVIDVKIHITQGSEWLDYTENAIFAGNASMQGSIIYIDPGPVGIPMHDHSPAYLRRLSGSSLALPSNDGSSFIGVKIDLSFINEARTDLPRVF